MKKYLLIIFMLSSFVGLAQDSIKVTQQLTYYVSGWPKNKSGLYKIYAAQDNGFLLTFPALEKNKKIEITNYYITEKNGNASIKQDPKNKNLFWIHPKEVSGRQPMLELEFRVSIKNEKIYYPVSKNGGKAFDEKGNLIAENVIWEELSKTFPFENGRYFIGEATLGVNKSSGK